MMVKLSLRRDFEMKGGIIMFGKLKALLCGSTVILISSIVTAVAPIISGECEVLWYQEIEPEGLDDFVSSKRKR